MDDTELDALETWWIPPLGITITPSPESIPAKAQHDIESLVAALRGERERQQETDFRYLCTKGHHVVSRLHDDLGTCDAILPWPETPESKPCGAQLHRYRTDYEDELEEALAGERVRASQLAEAAKAIIPHVEDCLRFLSTDNYRQYRSVWDATRSTLTDLQRALAASVIPSTVAVSESPRDEDLEWILRAALREARKEAEGERERASQLADALQAMVDDCVPAPNEGHIPNAPSERSYVAARAVLATREETT